MAYFLRFAHPWVIYVGVPFLLFVIWWRATRYRSITYRYSLADELATAKKNCWYLYFPLAFRALALFFLLLLIARLQMPDVKAPTSVEGIDMMLALDISGSMNYVDDQQDQRSRVEVAKDEAIQFVDKRYNDQIGLVLFARDCLSRCPMTLDKTILKDIIDEVGLGMLDPNGTMLCTGIALAINRLKHSKAASKVLIVLTDGAPSEGDLVPAAVVKLARKFGIKIYTIGIGGDKPVPMGFGFNSVPPVNKQLLQHLAHQTGGRFFEAKKPQDMQRVYKEIDALETTQQETDIYQNYHELFFPLACLALLFLCAEFILTVLVWFII